MAVAPPIKTLSSDVQGVSRALLRDATGRIVEVVDVPAGRAETLPKGGVFATFRVEEGRIYLGPPLARPIQGEGPPPLVVLGLAGRVLADLERLHAGGGAHGALALEGWGFDGEGVFRVRPTLHLAPPPGTARASDVAAIGRIVAALASPESLELSGLERARLWLRGMGVGASRVGFGDARAARQALAAVLASAPAETVLGSWLREEELRLPPDPGDFVVRPWVEAAQPDPAGPIAERVERELERMRAERYARDRARAEARVAAERARLAAAEAAEEALKEQALRAREAAAERERERRSQEEARRREAVEARLRSEEAKRRAEEAKQRAEEALRAAAAQAEADRLEAARALEARREEGVLRVRIGADAVPDVGAFLEALEAGDEEAGDEGDVIEVLPRARGTAIAANEEEIVLGEDDEASEGAEEAVAGAEGVEEAERAERAEAKRVEAERVEAERVEAERVEAERVEAERAEAERMVEEHARRETERAETERIAAEEAARREAERAEAQRIAAERAEAERLAAEERQEAERAETERLAAERAEVERAEAERLAAEEHVRREAERAEVERVAAERAEVERAEVERLAAEEAARREAERRAAEEAARREAERLAAEAARVEAERIAAEEAARREAERIAAEEAARRESERIAAEEAARRESERIAAERAEAARAEAERLAAERAEAARVEAERVAAEAARREAERLAVERAEAERENARREAARRDAARIAAERAEAERLEAARRAEEAARIAAAEAERRDALRRAEEAARLAEQPDDDADDHVVHLPGTPRWQGASSVGADPSRERELGPGKWTASGRSTDQILADLPPRERPEDAPPVEPLWQSAVGVTGSSAREREKGPGKWTASGRRVDELMEGLPSGPTREMDLDAPTPRRIPWVWIVVGIVLVAVSIMLVQHVM